MIVCEVINITVKLLSLFFKQSNSAKMQIKDKKAIVTGAASGLGLAFSRELLRNGTAVIIIISFRKFK